MWHPCCSWATPYCCFCFNFGPQSTCYIIAVLGLINVFSGLCNFGIGHVLLNYCSVINIGLHLIASVLLFLGTVWGKPSFKFAYCWMSSVGLFTVTPALVLYGLYHRESYVIWDAVSRQLGFIVVAVNAAWLFLWDFYTPIVVLGNLCDDCDDV